MVKYALIVAFDAGPQIRATLSGLMQHGIRVVCGIASLSRCHPAIWTAGASCLAIMPRCERYETGGTMTTKAESNHDVIGTIARCFNALRDALLTALIVFWKFSSPSHPSTFRSKTRGKRSWLKYSLKRSSTFRSRISQ
jgi:hypothetical protein